MRYFLKLSYRGTHFHGWQIQPNAPSVQALLQDKISLILGQATLLIGAGRTDTGVHAREMFAHFDSEEAIEAPANFCRRLNSMLGPEVAVQALLPVRAQAHARFDACEREYHYYLHQEKDPFLQDRSHFVHQTLDWGKMREASALLIGRHDFSSFSKSRTQVNNYYCDLRVARWEQVGRQWVFVISADRFLRNMVRAIVGTLLDVGRAKLSPEQVAAVLAARDRRQAGESAPAQGLFLTRVDYPQDIFIHGG